MEQPMPMVEKLVNRNLYKNYEFRKTLDDIYLTFHTGVYEKRRKDIVH